MTRARAVPSRVPWPLVAAVVLVGVEALALAGLGLLQLVTLSGDRVTMGATTAAFFLACAGGLLAGGWLLLRLQSWPRAPVVLAQLLQLGLAWSFRGGSTTLVAAVLAAVSLLVLAGLFHPSSLAALEHDQDA